MTDFDAFTSRLGFGQGRVPAGTDGDGAWAFVLGDVQAGRACELTVGDHAEVVQDVDLTGIALVRARITLRVPARMPPGLVWQASLVVDGVKRAVAAGRAGQGRRGR